MEYKSLSRLVYLAAGMFILIWFTHEILQVLLLFFFAIVFTIVLNAPTTWLESKKISRPAASLIVFFGVLIFLALFSWLIIPKIVTQVRLLINNLPHYINNLNTRITSWLGQYSDIKQKLQPGSDSFSGQLPSTPSILAGIGRYSLSIGAKVLLVIF